MHQATDRQLPEARYTFVDGMVVFEVLALQVFAALSPRVEPDEDSPDVVLRAFIRAEVAGQRVSSSMASYNDARICSKASGFVHDDIPLLSCVADTALGRWLYDVGNDKHSPLCKVAKRLLEKLNLPLSVEMMNRQGRNDPVGHRHRIPPVERLQIKWCASKRSQKRSNLARA